MNIQNDSLSILVRDLFSLFPERLLALLENILSFPHDFISLLDDIKNSSDVTQISASGSLIKNSYVHDSAYIGNFTLIRDSYISAGCKIGAHVEINRSIIMDNSVIPHHNYIGYSIIGRNVILGGNTRTAVRRLDNNNPRITINHVTYEANSKKFGAIIGDASKIGSSVIMNPITILGCNSLVHPNLTIIGYFPNNALVKNKQVIRGGSSVENE